MRVDNEYNLEEIVYLKTDINQYPRIITAIEIYAKGEILYKLCQGTTSSYHYPFEIAREKDILLTTDN